MADENPRGLGAAERPTTADEDLHEQSRVLREVLSLYPEALTLDELIRELTVGSSEFSEHDWVKRAVRDLISGGLVHQVGDLVLPTRAAVYLHGLSEL